MKRMFALALTLTFLAFAATSCFDSDDSSTSTDSTAPQPVTGFTATADGQAIDLAWTNSASPDYEGVLILFRTDGTFPTGPNDGNATAARAQRCERC